MQNVLVVQLIKILLGLLSEDLLKKFADTVLDFAEDKVLGSKSEVDDALVLPLCSMIRKTFDIPDNDIPE